MTEMVERVARAMQSSDALIVRFSPWVARELAKAAIAAMREPTAEMTRAFDAACDENGHCLARYGWRVMIDAALSDHEPGGE